MLLEEEENDCSEEKRELSIIWEDEDCSIEEPGDVIEVLLHALTGTGGLHTLSLKGSKGSRELSLLVDTWSTHNFMSNTTARAFGIKLEPCT